MREGKTKKNSESKVYSSICYYYSNLNSKVIKVKPKKKKK